MAATRLSLQASVSKVLAMDCEMVACAGDVSQIARVTVVNSDGECVLDSYVEPRLPVTDYRTAISGVRPEHLVGAPSFAVVQRTVADLLKHRVLVGHSVDQDLKVLRLEHPRHATRDTAHYRPLMRGPRLSNSLKHLAAEHLHLDIQTGEHDPLEDARAAMSLYKLHADAWEAWLKEKQALSRSKRPKKDASLKRKK